MIINDNIEQNLNTFFNRREMELRKKISSLQLCDNNEENNQTNDSEEIIRKIMVFYYPKIKSHKATDKQIRNCFLLFNKLLTCFDGKDLRYIDAFNAIYEKSVNWKKINSKTCWAYFLKTYLNAVIITNEILNSKK